MTLRIVAAHPGPHFSVHDVHVGWCEALRKLGNPVAEYNLSERLTFYDAALMEYPDQEVRKALTSEQAQELAINGLYATLYRLRPDLLFITSAFFYPPELLDLARRYGTRVVLVHTESPYEDERQIAMASHADINLINDPINIDRFRDVAPTYYVSHSYRSSLHCPGPVTPDLAADFAFIGTGYHSRIAFLEAMKFGDLDVFLGGNWQLLSKESPLRRYLAHDEDECLDNDQTVDVYRSSRCGMNLYRRESEEEHQHDIGWACGPREIEMAASGMFFLRDSRAESDELFPMLPTFTTPDEASDLLHWWLRHDDLRHEAAAKARASIVDRTFINRATELLRLLDK